MNKILSSLQSGYFCKQCSEQVKESLVDGKMAIIFIQERNTLCPVCNAVDGIELLIGHLHDEHAWDQLEVHSWLEAITIYQ
ncbi:MAG: hypothetical protein AB1489_30605 [Acidobacteriota bacterium]